MEKKSKLIILLANWYSGATLFTILMNRHSKIVSNGEGFPFNRNDMKRYRCSCGKYLDECNFYRNVGSHMREEDGSRWNREVFVREPSFSSKSSINRFLLSPRFDSSQTSFLISMISKYRYTLFHFLQAQYEFFKKATEYANASVFMDGTKSIRRAQLFARDDNMQLQVINLVRDGRAFCHSYIKNRKLETNQYGKAAQEWKDYINLAEMFHSNFSHIDYINIRYEDLCDQPDETLTSIFSFLDLPYEDVLTNPGHEMHILGNRMRNTFNGEIRKTTAWKEDLSDSDIKQIDSIIGRELKRFNYT